MISDFPRAYRVVRQGQWQMASVTSGQELAALRMELEIIHRFGRGAAPGLVAVLDARLTRTATGDQADLATRQAAVRDLQDMRGILCDAMATANARAIEDIDRDSPDIRTRLPMESIKKDAKQFRQDVTRQVKAAQADGSDADVEAMLAAFDQAAAQVDDAGAPAAQAAPGTAASATDDAMVDALLAEATPPTQDVDLNSLPEAAVVDPVHAAMAELAASADEETTSPTPTTSVPPVGESAWTDNAGNVDNPLQSDVIGDADADAAAGLETVSQRVAESLTHAERELDSIASAFEVAAVELGDMTAAVHKTSTVELSQPDQAAAFANAPSTGPTAGVKIQIQQARTRILSELDDVLVMLEHVDQMQAQADESLRKAKRFEQAAARAQEAGQRLAEAEAEAAKARAIFEQAQLRVSSVRHSWEQARQDAAAAAADNSPDQ